MYPSREQAVRAMVLRSHFPNFWSLDNLYFERLRVKINDLYIDLFLQLMKFFPEIQAVR